MATDWIKMRCDLVRDQRVLRIAHRIGTNVFDAAGRLLCVWSWADESAVLVFPGTTRALTEAEHIERAKKSRKRRDEMCDGIVTCVTLEHLDHVAHKPGFGAAMAAEGWVIEEPDETWGTRLRFPRFEMHNGSGARQRAKDADRKRLSRSGSDECHANGVTNGTQTVGQKSALEESRGEEIKKTGEKTSQPASATGGIESSVSLGGVGGGEEGNRHQASGIRGEADSCAQDSAGWLAGLSVREALRRLDVREPALSGLCSAQGITSEAIQAEWLEVCQVAVEQGLRNPTGVMLHRLAQKFHVELGASARLTREEQKTLAQLAKVRADFERVRSAGIERNGVHRRGAEAQRKAGVRA